MALFKESPYVQKRSKATGKRMSSYYPEQQFQGHSGIDTVGSSDPSSSPHHTPGRHLLLKGYQLKAKLFLRCKAGIKLELRSLDERV